MRLNSGQALHVNLGHTALTIQMNIIKNQQKIRAEILFV